MYAEYPTIFGSYLELAREGFAPGTASEGAERRSRAGMVDRAVALEALKRGVFLAWMASNSLPVETGLAELPESEVRELMKTLDFAIKSNHADDELRLMLAWYRDAFGAVFDYFGPVRSLDAFIRDVSSADVRAQAPALMKTNERGQMGRYWRGVLAAAS